jgi:TPR repeat protein
MHSDIDDSSYFQLQYINNYMLKNNFTYIELIDDDSIQNVYCLLKYNTIFESTDPQCLYYLGCYFYALGDIPNMISHLEKAASLSEPNSILLLGTYYDSVKKYKKMLHWYHIAADTHRLVPAMTSLGFYYKQKGNYDRMLKYYHAAIEDGKDPTAMNSLGIYYDEIGDKKNMLKYYTMAAKAGHSGAYFNLGIYADDNKDYKNMIKYYTEAAKAGIHEAMNNLGIYYYNNKDYKNMLYYYHMAIDHQSSNAMNNLGVYYRDNKDYKNMLKYFLAAAELDHTLATFNLGKYYEEIEKNNLKAFEYYQRSYRLGHDQANHRMNKLLQNKELRDKLSIIK